MRFLVLIFVFAAVLSAQAQDLPNDPFFGQQWGMKVQGQTGQRDISDIRSIPIRANPDIDLGWSLTLANRAQRDVIVAVIDSGLDIDHPDMEGQIAVNTVECSEDGRIPLRPTEDKDHNGYVGDCMGWNFIDGRDTPNGNQRPQDDVGHGTHVSGIIAAKVNNGIGISGFSNRIKILPLKVYDNSEGQPSAQRRKPLYERVARAMDYAVARRAAVINLSMGWPRVLNTDAVRSAIDRAVQAGVIVVAGAGNDSHPGLVFPCSQSGVICVGAIDMDGELSPFSNWGGQVDLYGPGGGILGLYPTTLFSFYGPRGYELLDGTSQSTPMVAGAAALLKSILNESSEQIIQRLVLGAKVRRTNNMDVHVLSLSGAMQAQSATTRPEFKSSEAITLSGLNFRLPVRIKSFAGSGSVRIRIRSSSHPQAFANPSQTVNLSRGVTVVNFAGRLGSMADSSILKYDIQINGRTYGHEAILVNDASSSAVRVALGTDQKVETVPNYPVLESIPEYFRTTAENGGIRIQLYRARSGSAEQKTLFVPQVSELLTRSFPIQRVDLNGDNQPDYVVFGLTRNAESNEAEALSVSYFNHAGSPLYAGSVGQLFNESTVVPQVGRVSYIAADTPYGPMKVPAFWTTGPIPTLDQNPNPFDFEENNETPRLYYIESVPSQSGPAQARLRLANNYLMINQLNEQLNLRFPDEVVIHGPIPQSQTHFNNGQLKLLISSGRGIDRTYRIATVSNNTLKDARGLALTQADYGSRNLLMQRVSAVTSLSGSTENVEAALVGLFNAQNGRVLRFSPDLLHIAEELEIRWPDEADPLVSIMRVYNFPNQLAVAYETQNHISVMGRNNGQSLNDSEPIYRYSYFPGQLFSQRYSPVIVGRSSQPRAGLFVDNSPLFAPQAAVWSVTAQGQLTVEARNSVYVPSNCTVLNPVRYQNDSVISMQCGSELRLVPIR